MTKMMTVNCTACHGSGESGLDDMGTPVLCENCTGKGFIYALSMRRV